MSSYTMRANGIYMFYYILFNFTWTYYTHKNAQLVFACRQLGLNMVELASLNMHGCWQACSCMDVGTDCSWLEQPWTWLLYQVGFMLKHDWTILLYFYQTCSIMLTVLLQGCSANNLVTINACTWFIIVLHNIKW